jgi:hypothetical protein
MEINWAHWECVLYCYGEVTPSDPGPIKLVKQ